MTTQFGKTPSMQDMLAAINLRQTNDDMADERGRSGGGSDALASRIAAGRSGLKSAFQEHFEAANRASSGQQGHRAISVDGAAGAASSPESGRRFFKATEKAGSADDSLSGEPLGTTHHEQGFEPLLPVEKSRLVEAVFRRLDDAHTGKGDGASDITLRALVEELVEPMLEKWLSEHLEDIVERRVEAEVQRISRLNR